MTIIEVDGRRSDVVFGGRVDELQNAVGGLYKIDCQIKFEGHICYVLVNANAWQRGDPGINIVATLLCGRMVWGTVVLVKRGVELL